MPYEEDVLRNPYSVKHWLRYLEFKSDGSYYVRNLLYERALKELPGSYKLWYAYLQERKQQVRGKPPRDSAYHAVNNAFERCLVYLHKVGTAWLQWGNMIDASYLVGICRVSDEPEENNQDAPSVRSSSSLSCLHAT